MKNRLPVSKFHDELVVNSINLHKELQIQMPHDTWISNLFQKYQFRIGYDYVIFDQSGSYELYICTASSITLAERTKLGIKIRRYLQWFLKEYEKRITQLLMELNDKAAQKGGHRDGTF